MDRLDRLRAFVLVAQRGSFAEAARLLRVSPTAVTRAVAALEASLGAQLLRRTTRSVRLTEPGATYLERCRPALAELDDAARQIAGEDPEPHGVLSVSAPLVFGRLHVAPLVAELLTRHPRLNVRLTLTDRMVRLVEEAVDVGVRIADMADSGMHAVKVGRVRRVLVASPGYLAARGTPAAPADLQAHDLIAMEALSPNDEWRFAPAAGGSVGSAVRIRPRLLTDSSDAAVTAATMGLGVALVLDYQARRELHAGALREVLPGFAPAALPVNLVYAANRHASPNLRAFIALARERLARL